MQNAMTAAPEKGAKTEPVDHRKQDRISLKKLKYFAAHSQETHCYDADLYFDGRKVGTVGNAGHGGCDDLRVTDQAAMDDLQRYVATFDSVNRAGGDWAYSYQPDLETVCCDLVNDWLVADELKKLMRKRVLVSRDTGLVQTNCASNAAQRDRWAQDYLSKGETVLNLMPFADALALYRAEVG